MYQIDEEFITPMQFCAVEGIERINGKPVKRYSESPQPFFASFKTFGGTESTVNGVLVVKDTATVKTWYDPAFQSGGKVKLDGKEYEIIGEPEDVEQRHKYTIFKVERIKGGA